MHQISKIISWTWSIKLDKIFFGIEKLIKI